MSWVAEPNQHSRSINYFFTKPMSYFVHQYQDLIILFNQCFEAKYNTKLVKGEEEPLYLPTNEHNPHNSLFFAHGFFSSALHECAHWLIAGKERRKLIDFGYWYEPDGRNEEQQRLFQQVEVKPQALEWILSVAANYPFRVSIDNLNGTIADTQPFKEAIYQQILNYCQHGLPGRAQLFRKSLCRFYGTKFLMSPQDFCKEKL